MKKIMILGAGILQVPAIKKAKEMGMQVIAVDMNPNAVGFLEEGIVCEVISTIDIPEVLKAAKKHKIDGIMTLASDMPIRTIAKVSKELGIRGVSEETALKTTDKVLMRQALASENVPIPLFFQASNYEEFCEAIERIRKSGFKCIVKPADNSGSRGVNLLSSFESEKLLETYLYSKSYSRNKKVIVEEYMEGCEVSVETFSTNGQCSVIQITDKITTGAPYFVEMGHSQPSMLAETTKEQISEVAILANKAVGIVNGPSHTEIKVTKNGPKIVEIGARLGGDNITTKLVPLSTGIDMVEACIKDALGESVCLDAAFEKGASIRFFSPRAGILRGYNLPKRKKGIIDVQITKEIGEKIYKITNSLERTGFVISQGNTTEEAVKLCEEYIKNTEFIVE